MSRTRENGVVVWGLADAGVETIGVGAGIPKDSEGGYAGGDSTADAINGVRGTAEQAYQTIDSMTATAHEVPRGSEPTVTVTGPMGAKVLNVGIPAGIDPPRLTSFRALAPLRPALATGTARVVGVGDSNTEGANMTSRNVRWFDTVIGDLRQRVTGGDTGIGWVPAMSLGGPSGFSWTGGSQADSHVGGRGRVLSGGAVGTFTGKGSVTVMWQGGSGGTFTVKVGSQSAQTIDASTGSGTQQQTITASGSNTVTVTGTAGSPVFYGAMFATDDTGVHGWNLGQSGSRADTWAHGDPAWGAPDSEQAAMQAIGLIDPHLVVISLGANGLSGVFGDPYPPETYAADMADIVGSIQTQVAARGGEPPGFLLITPPQSKENLGTALDDQWLRFEQELLRGVGNDPLVSVLHCSDVWAPVSPDPQVDPAGYLSDQIHWSARGHEAIAEYVTSWVARGFGSLPSSVASTVVDNGDGTSTVTIGA